MQTFPSAVRNYSVLSYEDCNCRVMRAKQETNAAERFYRAGQRHRMKKKKKRKESRDGAVSVALTSRNLGRAHNKAKCSGGR